MSFTKKKSVQGSLEIIGTLVQVCCNKGGHICSKLKKLFDQGDYLGIIDYQFDYHNLPLDSNDILYARQIQGLFSKQDFLNLGIDKEEVAFLKFLQSEEQCRETNRRFRIGAPAYAGVEEVLYLSRRKIASILGDVPDISELTFKFGPGTNTSTSMEEANPRIKLSSSLECSMNFAPFARAFLSEFPNWEAAHQVQSCLEDRKMFNDITFSLEEYWPVISVSKGQLCFVPKTCKTKRVIVKETILNGFYQKGVGSYIRQCLAEHGLDLRDQQKNRDLARKGSESDRIATIDLSAASDTIAYGFVLDQLPPEWFHFLEIGRTEAVTYKKKDLTIELQKFSSMGNAYTFELESLLFYSLACSVCEHLHIDSKDVRSYGDDIIIPVTAVPLMTEVISYCGFTINLEKSYWSGPFRESCGADYLYGFDIRPFYLKEQISERVLYLMHNWFVRHCENELADAVLSFVRHDEALWGPDGYGDGHLVGNHKLRTSRTLIRNGYGGGVFDTYTTKKRHNKRRYFGDWVYPCYSIYARFGNSDEYELGFCDGLVTWDKADSITGTVIPSTSVDPDATRGLTGYKKISIYTLATSIFGRVNQSD